MTFEINIIVLIVSVLLALWCGFRLAMFGSKLVLKEACEQGRIKIGGTIYELKEITDE